MKLRALAPALLAGALLPNVLVAAYRSLFVTLGRDQGIFQYVAWAMGQGDAPYRDIRDVNGPLIHWIHRLFLMLGGGNEFRFRLLDVLISFAVFGFVGSMVPRRSGSRTMRLACALLGCALLGGQYFRYLWWDLAQRESLCDWFVLGAGGLLMSPSRRREFGAGALLAAACFGKPTFVVFALIGAGTVLLGEVDRLRAVMMVALGGLAAALGFMLVLWGQGGLQAFVTIYVHDARVMYAYIWPHTMRELALLPWVTTPLAIGAIATLVGAGAWHQQWIARRAMFWVLMPLGGALSVALQKKGFPYHLHPITAGAASIALVVLVGLVEHVSTRPSRWHAAALALLGTSVSGLETSAFDRSWLLLNPWLELPGERDFAKFRIPDFYPAEMREVAAYLATASEPSDTMQVYGMDPYVLFLAQRRSATPYIYLYDLNTDAAFNGALETLPAPKNQNAAAQIRAMGAAHAGDLLWRIQEKRPKFWIFFDNAPLASYPDSMLDLARSQPAVFAEVENAYTLDRNFGSIRLYKLKNP